MGSKYDRPPCAGYALRYEHRFTLPLDAMAVEWFRLFWDSGVISRCSRREAETAFRDDPGIAFIFPRPRHFLEADQKWCDDGSAETTWAPDRAVQRPHQAGHRQNTRSARSKRIANARDQTNAAIHVSADIKRPQFRRFCSRAGGENRCGGTRRRPRDCTDCVSLGRVRHARLVIRR